MKRDADLIRAILLALEEHEHGYAPHPLEIEGYTEDEISYHVLLMLDAGLVEGGDWSTKDGPEGFANRLTWAGHEFLDAARNDSTWRRAKDALVAAGSGLSIELLGDALKQLIRGQLGGGA